jgi:hypothetical protein
MATTHSHPGKHRQVAAMVRRRVESGGERLWRLDDFHDLPLQAVVRTLSRLHRAGTLQRLSKGTYYRPKDTAFGASRPNPTAVQQLATQHAPMFPSGLAAANLLGFTTQNPARREVATTARSLPRKLVGADTLVHTGRPAAWSRLPAEEACVLDFLRGGGAASELSPDKTVDRLVGLLREQGRMDRLLGAARTEPPRVRAMLGALAERLGEDAAALRRLRETLNPLSRFDFGTLSVLPNARAWQAREG